MTDSNPRLIWVTEQQAEDIAEAIASAIDEAEYRIYEYSEDYTPEEIEGIKDRIKRWSKIDLPERTST